MLCRYPYIKNYNVTKGEVFTSPFSRNEATPFGCGQCIPCRANKARILTHRVLLETMDHPYSSFLTLTFSDSYLPEDGNLYKKPLQDYYKRLRYRVGKSFRYLGVGEYGEKSGRPHYHTILFGLHMQNHYRDMQLAWTKKGDLMGKTHVMEVNKDTARYITGYCMKGMTRKNDKWLHGREPEFSISSKQEGGLGLNITLKIGEAIKNDPNYKGHVVREFTHGKKKYPLGRYLTEKLADHLGVSEEQKKLELYKYQNELFEDNLDIFGNYYENIVDGNSQKRHNYEKALKMFSQGRSM